MHLSKVKLKLYFMNVHLNNMGFKYMTLKLTKQTTNSNLYLLHCFQCSMVQKAHTVNSPPSWRKPSQLPMQDRIHTSLPTEPAIIYKSLHGTQHLSSSYFGKYLIFGNGKTDILFKIFFKSTIIRSFKRLAVYNTFLRKLTAWLRSRMSSFPVHVSRAQEKRLPRARESVRLEKRKDQSALTLLSCLWLIISEREPNSSWGVKLACIQTNRASHPGSRVAICLILF